MFEDLESRFTTPAALMVVNSLLMWLASAMALHIRVLIVPEKAHAPPVEEDIMASQALIPQPPRKNKAPPISIPGAPAPAPVDPTASQNIISPTSDEQDMNLVSRGGDSGSAPISSRKAVSFHIPGEGSIQLGGAFPEIGPPALSEPEAAHGHVAPSFFQQLPDKPMSFEEMQQAVQQSWLAMPPATDKERNKF